MFDLLETLKKLKTANQVISILIGIYTESYISPAVGDDAFIIGLRADGDEEFEDEILCEIIVHVDGKEPTYHVSRSYISDKFNSEKIGEALAASLEIFDKYKR